MYKLKRKKRNSSHALVSLFLAGHHGSHNHVSHNHVSHNHVYHNVLLLTTIITFHIMGWGHIEMGHNYRYGDTEN